MKILLVDDDSYLLEAIKTMVDWKKVGIDGVYTAGQAAAAKKIIVEEPIDLMLCDIEMVKENGLELIAWCREQEFDIEAIILSSYARFEYAKKAIELSSYDYLVKPVAYPELEEKISGAVAKIREKRVRENYAVVGRQSGAAMNILFWSWFLMGRTPQKELEVGWREWRQELEREDGLYHVLLLDHMEYGNALEQEEEGMKDYTMRELLGRLDECYPFALKVVFRAEDQDLEQHIAVIRREGGAGAEGAGASASAARESLPEGTADNQLVAYTTAVGQAVGQILAGKCRCFVGEAVDLLELPEQVRQVYRMMEDTISGNGQVYFLESYVWRQAPYVEPTFQEWKEMLLNGKGREVSEAIGRYLDAQAEKQGLNGRNIRRFLLSFQYMLYEVMKEKQLLVSYLDARLQEETFENQHFYSVAALKQYVNREVGAVCSKLGPVEESGSVIPTVLAYIDEHLGEDLNRNSFAEVVYLNPNYLARLFKTHTGVSLGNYLMKRRVDRAKDLLAYTTVPINSVALQVGYDNFSYFARVFRKLAGCSPNEYRKRSAAEPGSGLERA